MKVVVAEKISSSAIDLLREPRWTIVTPDQVEGKLAAQLQSADALIVRSAVQVDADLLEHARKLRVIGRAGRGRGQHRSGCRHPQGHRRDEHARRQCHRRGRTCAGADAGHGPPYRPRQRADACREVGKEISAGHRTARQDPGHRGPGKDRHGSGAAGAGLRDGDCRARSLCLHRGGQGAGHPPGQAGRSLCRRRLPHPARGTHAADRGHDQRGFGQENETRGAGWSIARAANWWTKPLWRRPSSRDWWRARRWMFSPTSP